jgi:flagellar biosynthesis/type III secretory pathway protein FliH
MAAKTMTIEDFRVRYPKIFREIYQEGFELGKNDSYQRAFQEGYHEGCAELYGGEFEKKVREAISSGLAVEAAFLHVVRSFPKATSEYFQRVHAGGFDGLKGPAAAK